MTLHEKNLVQGTFAQVALIGEVAEELFYGRLFEINPSIRPLFRSDMRRQGRDLILTLAIVIQGLDRLQETLPVVQEMGRRHARYGMRDEQYHTVGSALLWTLRKTLGDGFTPEVESAWIAVYTLLADAMKSGAMELAA